MQVLIVTLTLSEATGTIQLTLAVEEVLDKFTLMFEGHDEKTGDSVSATTTLKVQVPSLLAASRALQVTEVVPIGNVFRDEEREQFVEMIPEKHRERCT